MRTQQRSKKILIVEDNIDLLHALGLALELQGYEPIRVTEGSRAMDMASSHLPDLILLDMSMPDMDGLQVASRIRQGQETRSIPILCMTGRSAFSYREISMQNGCTDHIAKPFSVEQLCSRIEKLLR